jgi:regulatory protein
MGETYTKLLSYSMYALGRRNHTVSQLRDKMLKRLQKWKIQESQHEELCDQVIVRLRELHLLDDLLFCERWVADRARFKPRGRYLLTQELRKKGIPQDIIELYWESASGEALDEYNLALEFVQKQLERLKRRDLPHQKCREKLYRALASRGFNGSAIRASLDKVEHLY